MDELWESKEEPHARDPDIILIQLAIHCMTAAESLHIVKMKGHSMASLTQDVNTLVDAGHTTPPAQEVHIAFVQVREYMEGKKYCQAGEILSLTANSSPWSIGNAGFGQCAALSALVESSLYAMFIELWCEAMLPNCFWKFLNTVEDMSSRKQFELWLRAQGAILDSCEDALAGDLEKLVKLYRRVFSGLLGLVCAKPGVADLDDVRLVFPQNMHRNDLC